MCAKVYPFLALWYNYLNFKYIPAFLRFFEELISKFVQRHLLLLT